MFATGWVRYFVTRDAGFDPLQFDPGAYASRMEQLKTLLESTDPDLSAFRARKGKLLLWHGLADPAANPKSTVAYYQDVVAKAGGRAQADQFVKLYTAPGVSHCAGGAGADTAKLLPVLRNWVENDADPAATQIVATRLEAGAATLSRPLCAYPQYPKYKGSGDPALASSFACSDPI
jgi:feruloyl esterase